MTRPAGSTPWYRDRRKRDRATVYGFAVLGVAGVLLGGVLQFAKGDQRVMVVTLERDPSTSLEQLAERRQLLKDACGDLPGIAVVPDRGRADAQARFPVRFSLRGTSNPQQAALEACLEQYRDVVRGYQVEGRV